MEVWLHYFLTSGIRQRLNGQLQAPSALASGKSFLYTLQRWWGPRAGLDAVAKIRRLMQLKGGLVKRKTTEKRRKDGKRERYKE
jgi:hypothetical protein